MTFFDAPLAISEPHAFTWNDALYVLGGVTTKNPDAPCETDACLIPNTKARNLVFRKFSLYIPQMEVKCVGGGWVDNLFPILEQMVRQFGIRGKKSP